MITLQDWAANRETALCVIKTFRHSVVQKIKIISFIQGNTFKH